MLIKTGIKLAMRGKRMILKNQFEEIIDVSLRDFERILKEVTSRHPSKELKNPHSFSDIKIILEEANLKGRNTFAELLLNQELEEELFFKQHTDVEIYQHLRYLPAYWHSHNFVEIACVIQGQCTNYILEQQLEMKQGDICIIAPGTKHAISAFSDDCLMFNILLRTSTFETAFFGVLSGNDFLSDFFMHTLYSSNRHPYLLFRSGNDAELLNYIGFAHQEFRRNRQYKNRMLISIIDAFFITLLRNQGANVILPDTPSDGDENTILILKYIQEHYTTVTLTELATFFNYSERQIQRIIKGSTGVSFSENIQKLKLRQATNLLRDKNQSISAIAEELGFCDPGTFRNVFKKYYNMTPTEYRTKPQ